MFVCLCLLRCFIQSIEEIVKVLNNNAVIVMSVTGESYIDSAKHAIYIIVQNFQLFLVVEIINSLITFCGMLFIAGVPAIIGYFLLSVSSPDPSTKTDYTTAGVVIIVLASFMIAMLFLSVISESLSSVFIFY